jgi:hypothetical protein
MALRHREKGDGRVLIAPGAYLVSSINDDPLGKRVKDMLTEARRDRTS